MGKGRPACAEMTHAAAAGEPGAGVRIASTSLAPASRGYHLVASAAMETCRGYGRPSSSALAGGTDSADGVDCWGDCKSGRNYCYAGANGRWLAASRSG